MNCILIATLLAACVIHTSSALSFYNYPDRSPATANLKTSKGFPACSPDTEQWSGYFQVNATTNKNYFYWAFGPRSGNPDAPIILWMTGGPGCSSSLATLAENGPCHINLKTGDLERNPYAWNTDAYIIYIDQPAGVGFSYSDGHGRDRNEAEVSTDMYWFMQEWLNAHPELTTRNKLFVFGESYGGHFAPATAHRIWDNNRKGIYPYIPLTGLGVGNGMTAPYIQYNYYVPFVTSYCEEKIGEPCVSPAASRAMEASVPQCTYLIRACMAGDQESCPRAEAYCDNAIEGPYQNTGRNVYDIRKPCIGELCYNFSQIVQFMNRVDVQMSLGVKPQHWQTCNMAVNSDFSGDFMHSFDSNVADMINSGDVRAMIYAGDVDFICNWLGNQAWVRNLPWAQTEQFNRAPVRNYILDSELAATTQSVSGHGHTNLLSFVRVFDAGHMVPMDKPQVILNLITKFMRNEQW
eukprot:Tbor_TRINITY_DN5850_c1_g1::TRINITY_DN5850_c1_g1_i3::g.7155::m.7155